MRSDVLCLARGRAFSHLLVCTGHCIKRLGVIPVEVARIIYNTDNEMGVMTSIVSSNEMVLPPAADGDQPEDVVWVQVDNNQITQFLDLLHKCPDAWTDAGVRDVLSAVE